MKTFEINALGMDSLSSSEMKKINGGGVLGGVGGLIGFLISAWVYMYEHQEELNDICQQAKEDWEADHGKN